MRNLLMLSGLSLVLGLQPAIGQEGHDQSATALPLCPLMGEPINLAISARTDQGPVFFCCGGCVERYQKDPDKYAAKVAAQHKAMAKRPKIQVLCPVTNESVDGKTFSGKGEERIYFCCGGCKKKYEAAPDKYAAGLANSFTHQVTCPVMGEPISPAAFVNLPTGEKIYLCCQRCDQGLLKDPAKYAPKLAAQGIFIDVSKLQKPSLGG